MDIITKVTRDAERLLKSLRAEYYIKLPTGKELKHGLAGYGMLPKAEPKVAAKKTPAAKQRKPSAHGLAVGTLAAHFRPHLEKCTKAGEVVEIPIADFDIKHLRGSVSAWCCTHWGKNTYMTTMNRDKGQVEVMRLTDAKKDTKTAPAASKVSAQSKGNGHDKFHTVGHGLDSLANLNFDDPKN